jgi:hypothetical protein
MKEALEAVTEIKLAPMDRLYDDAFAMTEKQQGDLGDEHLSQASAYRIVAS